MPACFRYVSKQGEVVAIETTMRGKTVLNHPKLNKGSAFTDEERKSLQLQGQLPYKIETLDEQCARAYAQYLTKSTPLDKNIYLQDLQDTNRTLFYRLLSEHLVEMMPIIYTPTMGEAVERFSTELRRPRSIYLSYPMRDQMEDILSQWTGELVDCVVATDGEGVLGIGDQGVGAMNIAKGKLTLYTLLGGLHPYRTLPVMLDVGTNNQKLLKDPLYLGWRHPRISGPDYDEFIEQFVTILKKHLGNVFLHWEDFGRSNASRLLTKFEDKIASFNDDIQGTGAITLACILSAINAAKMTKEQQRIVVFGAGTAGIGIADQIFSAFVASGLDEEQVRNMFYLVDRQGLLTEASHGLTPGQKRYARPVEEPGRLPGEDCDLEAVVEYVKPTILIGCSTVFGAFSESIVKTMAKHCPRPIILPLSNPTSNIEAMPAQLIEWTHGQAIIATGTPFPDVHYHHNIFQISQNNNAYVYPGVGLGVVAVKATAVSHRMIHAACEVVTKASPARNKLGAPLLPPLDNIRDLSLMIARAVAQVAIEDNLAQHTPEDLDQHIRRIMWEPRYYPVHAVDDIEVGYD